jgi:hypothetical protein
MWLDNLLRTVFFVFCCVFSFFLLTVLEVGNSEIKGLSTEGLLLHHRLGRHPMSLCEREEGRGEPHPFMMNLYPC